MFIVSNSFAANKTMTLDENISKILIQQVFYKDGIVYLDGFKGSGIVTIYSIIGNKIFSTKVSNLSSKKTISVNLKSGNMFIIQIHSGSSVDTFKIIA
tara:strand:- start:12 stop:305 length:294 start_codon:yes stop_codon:yes gene_type:complete